MPFRLRGFRLRCAELVPVVNRHHEQGPIDSIAGLELSKTGSLVNIL